jgi:hypothetical protein
MQQSAHSKRKTPLTSHLPIIRIFTRHSTALLESDPISIPQVMVSGGVSPSVLDGGGEWSASRPGRFILLRSRYH